MNHYMALLHCFRYLTLVEQLNEFSFIKALKVLRALRTIAVVPGQCNCNRFFIFFVCFCLFFREAGPGWPTRG